MVRSQSLDGNTFHSSTPSDVTGGGDGEFPLEKHRWESLPCTLGCWAVEGGAFNGGLHRGEQALAAAHMPARRDRRVYRRRQADWTDIARKIFCTPPHRRRGGRLGGIRHRGHLRACWPIWVAFHLGLCLRSSLARVARRCSRGYENGRIGQGVDVDGRVCCKLPLSARRR